MPLQFVASGYDEPRGELVLKVVNATETPYPVTFRLKGAGDVVPDGQVITLAADSALAENSFEEPRKITPVVSAYGDFGRKFTYESVRSLIRYCALRLKKKLYLKHDVKR